MVSYGNLREFVDMYTGLPEKLTAFKIYIK